jgi:hypothetical protein
MNEDVNILIFQEKLKDINKYCFKFLIGVDKPKNKILHYY